VQSLQQRHLIPLQYVFLLNTFNEDALISFFVTQTQPYEIQILNKDKSTIEQLGFIQDSSKIDDVMMEQLRILYVCAKHLQ
jgi:hypothetical protein